MNLIIKSAAIRTNNGEIYTGKNHAEIFKQKPMGYFTRNQKQGFVTDSGVFVDRKEALTIAIENKQIVKKHGCEDELYSEDLREGN